MSTQAATSDALALPHGHEPKHNYLKEPAGLWSWLTTVDHKRIGLMYLFSVMAFFGVAGILGLLIRIELIAPGQTIVTADTYNQVFSLHGIMMIFLFIIPSIPASLGNFVLPLMIGAGAVLVGTASLMASLVPEE